MYLHASAADVVAVNPNRIKTLLANALCTLLIEAKTAYSNGEII